MERATGNRAQVGSCRPAVRSRASPVSRGSVSCPPRLPRNREDAGGASRRPGCLALATFQTAIFHGVELGCSLRFDQVTDRPCPRWHAPTLCRPHARSLLRRCSKPDPRCLASANCGISHATSCARRDPGWKRPMASSGLPWVVCTVLARDRSTRGACQRAVCSSSTPLSACSGKTSPFSSDATAGCRVLASRNVDAADLPSTAALQPVRHEFAT